MGLPGHRLLWGEASDMGALTLDDVEAVVWERCRPRPSAVPTGSVGIEAETLPLTITAGGQPAGRAAAAQLAQLLRCLAPVVHANGTASRWAATDGGVLTLEPGGQLE